MLTVRMKNNPVKAKRIINEITDYDDTYSNENKMFRMKKPSIAQDYIAEYRIITDEKEPRIFEILQSAMKISGKLKYSLTITVDSKPGNIKDLEKLIS
jgi:hypothetical protein